MRDALAIRLSAEFFEAGHWGTCDQVSALMGEESIQRCSELAAVLKAHGRVLVRFLTTLPPNYEALRLIARETVSGVQVASWRANRSTETGQLVPWNNGEPVTLCEWCPLADRCPDRLTNAGA